VTTKVFDHKNIQLNGGLSKSRYVLILCIGCLIALVGARYVNLDADPPPDYIPIDSGYHIDEGYKTFAPKNLFAFGQTNWHEKDSYRGWMETSPLTQRP